MTENYTLKHAEKEAVLKALKDFPDLLKAAKALGISRAGIYRRIKKFKIGTKKDPK